MMAPVLRHCMPGNTMWTFQPSGVDISGRDYIHSTADRVHLAVQLLLALRQALALSLLLGLHVLEAAHLVCIPSTCPVQAGLLLLHPRQGILLRFLQVRLHSACLPTNSCPLACCAVLGTCSACEGSSGAR